MSEISQFLVEHGYLLLVAFVLCEQLGVPLPATPMLLAAGALAGSGNLHLGKAFALGVLACVAADTVWYRLGRRYGNHVVHWLCRFTLEPDDCSRRTGDLYHRHGVMALVVAKYVPGLNTIAPPLAGLLRLRWYRFLLFDGIGAALWVGGMLLVGYVFSDQVEAIGRWVSHFGFGVTALVVLVMGGWIALKVWIRRRFVARLRTARIEARDVWERIRRGDPITVVDLRHEKEIEVVGAKVPGAIEILPQQLGKRAGEIPRDRDIVIYCSCPNEATSARTAMRLQEKGIRRIRPLLGGFEGWVEAGLPVESVRALKFGGPRDHLFRDDEPDESLTSSPLPTAEQTSATPPAP